LILVWIFLTPLLIMKISVLERDQLLTTGELRSFQGNTESRIRILVPHLKSLGLFSDGVSKLQIEALFLLDLKVIQEKIRRKTGLPSVMISAAHLETLRGAKFLSTPEQDLFESHLMEKMLELV